MQIHCKFDQLVDPKKLKNNPQNRNKHGQDQIDRLAELYKYHGIRHPIIISEQSGFIVAGHGRKLAAIRAGIKEFPVVFQSFSNNAAEYAFLQADNAIASWADLDIDNIKLDIGDFPDLDLNMLGIRDFQVEELKEFLADPDDIPEEIDPKAKLGDIYKLGDHRLMCGDSTSIDAVEKLMDGEKADMVFTDPPYGMSAVSSSGVLSKKYHKDIMNDNSTNVAKDAFNLVVGLGIPKLVFWGANYYSSSLPDSTCWLVWDKNNGQSDQMDCELAWTSLKGVTRQFTQASEKSNRVHPTQKPVSLPEWCFERYEAGSVLDLFGGSGSTLIACEKTNRKCFMMELDPHYCDVIVARWEKFTGNKAELINGKA